MTLINLPHPTGEPAGPAYPWNCSVATPVAPNPAMPRRLPPPHTNMLGKLVPRPLPYPLLAVTIQLGSWAQP